MEDIKSNNNKVYEILICVLSLAVNIVAGFLYGLDNVTIVKNAIIIGIIAIALYFLMELEKIKGHYNYGNDVFLWRFFIVFVISLLASSLFPIFPSSGWIFCCLFISLSLFSNPFVGILSGVLVLTNTILITNNSSGASSFLIYVIPGIVGIVLFSSVDEEFKVFVPMIISLLFQFLCLSVNEVLIVNKPFGIGMFMIPFVNILICVAVLLFVLKLFSFSMLYKTHDRLMDIIDPEFELLARLKETSKEDYDHTIYTAVLCSKLANAMGMDENISKAVGCYHRIGILTNSNTWSNVKNLLEENEIPAKVIDLLMEYIDPDKEIKSREIAVLLFSDTIISSIRYLFEKDKDTKIDYGRLVDAVFDKKLPIISNSKISFEDINIMKKVLKNENLFYDFLR